MKKSSRAERRARAVARVDKPIPVALKAKDPLVHPEATFAKKLGWVGVVILLAGVLHVVALVSLGVAATVMRAAPADVVKDETLTVAIVEPPPPPPPPPVAEEPPPPPPEPEPEAPKPKPKPKPEPKPEKTEPPPPDPTDVPPEPPPPTDKPPPRRIVGLSLESTVGGGDGPAFAVGNTRMGTTERTAEDTKEVKSLPKTQAPPPPAKVNRAATRIPVADEKLVPPKYKKRVEPKYPEAYRAQNLEGTVTVQLTVLEDGTTAEVKILKGSPYPEFNDAALAAARATTFEPATRGGKAVRHTLSFSYTFRFTD